MKNIGLVLFIIRPKASFVPKEDLFLYETMLSDQYCLTNHFLRLSFLVTNIEKKNVVCNI